MFNFKIAFQISMALLFLFVCVAVFTNLDEDAFISFRYVDQLYAGNGLVFNAGERVEGYSNFLWIVLKAQIALCGPIIKKAGEYAD